MTESKVDEFRAQFEAWISDGGEGGAFFGKPRLEVDGENEFIDPDTYGAWLTWQAALRSPAVAELIEAAKDAECELAIQPRVNSYVIDKLRAALAACTPAKSEGR